MKYLYHYTTFENLFPSENNSNFGILKPKGLSLWARPHKLFQNKEYLWIKDSADASIKHLLSLHGVEYDKEDVTNVQPGIISFCSNVMSDYMWKRYAKHCNDSHGVVLVLNYSEIEHQCISESRYDSLAKCCYLKKYNSTGKLSTIISNIRTSLPYSTYSLQSDFYMSVAFLKQKHFKKEKEIRYVRSGPLFTFDPENGFNDDPDPVGGISEAPSGEFVIFQHNSLRKIIVDSKVSGDDINKLKTLLFTNGYNNVEICIKS